MSTTIVHERPGVYSSYDASSTVRGSRTARTLAVAAKAASGETGRPVTLTSLAQGLAAFGEDAPDAPGMSALLSLLFAGGAGEVIAVAVDGGDYASAFAALEALEGIGVVVCDSGELTVHQALRDSVERASLERRERIAVAGMENASAAQLIARAGELNSERVVLAGPDALDTAGNALSGVFAAAALAAAIAGGSDPATPVNGASLAGLGGVAGQYSENDVDLLVRGGVTPLEAVGGVVSPVRCVTTRTSTGGSADATWRELTTVLIVDDVIPAIRRSLRARFSRTKNTAQTRGAIRSQVIVDLESKVKSQIITEYGDVSVSASEDDPAVCLVEFSFAVAHGLNQIYLTAHITV